MTCHKHRHLCDAQRQTWAKDPKGADIRFFLGRGGEAQRPDEVILDVEDGYRYLPKKCTAIFKWALEHGYDYVFKTDSDVYVQMDRLVAAVPVGRDYVGRLRGPARDLPAPYCSGMGYWLSRKAMEARVAGADDLDFNEDLTTGNILYRAGIMGELDTRYCVVMSQRSALNGQEGPREGNDVIASCEYDEGAMHTAHKEFLTVPSGEPPLKMPTGTPFDRVDVMVKTFLRDGMMRKCCKGIEQYLPGARIILLDDGWEEKGKVAYCYDLISRGHKVIKMPFDSGYGAKNNEARKYYEREFVLRIADDFDFSDPAAAEGVLKMIDVMDNVPRVAIASGRVNNNPYEGNVKFMPRHEGLDCIATRADVADFRTTEKGTRYTECYYTVNYSLIRSEVMKAFEWDEKFKIGGDHLDLYMYVHNNELGKVVYVHGANVNTIPDFPGAMHRDYPRYRGRATLSLPWTFERHGWASWTDFSGRTETRESVADWAERAMESGKHAPRKTREEKRAEKLMAREERLERRAERKRAKGEWLYKIDPAYKHRDKVPHFDATETKGEWQKEVYELAHHWYVKEGLRSVIDLGCGTGEKLLRHFSDVPHVGVEVEPTLTWLRKKHPYHRWSSPDQPLTADMVICADVIEHMIDPDQILDYIKKAGAKIAVISTPDRSLIPGAMAGPPRNIHHVREWTMKEFDAYLRDYFDVLDHHICNAEQFTQVAVIRP